MIRKGFLVIIAVSLFLTSAEANAQPGPIAVMVETCADLQELSERDALLAIELTLARAAGFVEALEREGVVDDLLPMAPEIVNRDTLRMLPSSARRDRTGFVMDRLRMSCWENPDQTLAEALDVAVTDAQGAFLERQRLKDALHRRSLPGGDPYDPSDPNCVPETGEGCDLFRLL